MTLNGNRWDDFSRSTNRWDDFSRSTHLQHIKSLDTFTRRASLNHGAKLIVASADLNRPLKKRHDAIEAPKLVPIQSD